MEYTEKFVPCELSGRTDDGPWTIVDDNGFV